MRTTTEQKLINVFGQNTLFDLQKQAEHKGKWIVRHCNTLYITQFNKEDNSFSYFIEKNSNRLHKFKDRSKINFIKKHETD